MSNTPSSQGMPMTMQSYDDSLARICAEAAPRPPVSRPLFESVGLVLAEDLTAPLSVPSFDNSAMDGFAFSAAAVATATPDRPIRLTVAGASIAGAEPPPPLQKGTAVKIMTGAPLPKGADTILPVEAAGWDHETLIFDRPYPAGRHVRREGEDIMAGAPLLAAGTRIAPQHLPLLCAAGQARLPVSPAPRVVWISTGQEISDDFNAPLAAGQIYNATRLYGQVMASDIGMKIIGSVTVRDTPEDFADALHQALESDPDLILSTGGVSAGQYDFVRPVLERIGADIILHKARIKPAKPVLFARLQQGSFFFGLPGNPISTALALRIFVAPFIRRFTGRAPEMMRKARLAGAVETADDKTVFLMGTVAPDITGALIATAQTGQHSFRTASFAAGNAWIIVPEGTGRLEAGAEVIWLPFHPEAAL
tara:strand:- start:17805 stop:19073 length:1269 start_codon:yes stop_codon:yes gene_type:complete